MVRRKRQLHKECKVPCEDWDDSVNYNPKIGKIGTSPGDNEDNEANSTSCSYLKKGLHMEIQGIESNVIDRNLAMFIISSNIDFDIIDTPSFVDFVRGVAEFGPQYNLPSSLMLQRKSFPIVEMEIEEYVKKVRQSWEVKGCTIMLDMWQDFINIIAYSPDGVIFLKLHEIPKHSNFDVKDIVSSAIEDIGANHVVQVISNTDIVYKSVENLLLNKYSRIYQIRCVAHEIHSLLKAMYNEVGWVKAIIDSAAFVVKRMNRNVTMRQNTKAIVLKHPCKSRFASNYQMLQSILGNKNELQQFVESEEWKINEIIASKTFWDHAQDLVNVMEPLVQVLRLVEDDRPNSGYLYESMEKARQAIESHYRNDHRKYCKILDLFAKWRSKKILHPIHAAAAFLNPAYMCQNNFKFNNEISAGIEFVWANLVRNEEKEKFVEEVTLYREKKSNAFNTLGWQMLKVSHPRIWWDYAGVCFPVLKKYAIRILSQPCKCSCDQPGVFELAQKRVLDGTIWQQKSVQIKTNAKIMEHFRSRDEKRLMPIDLDNCNELPDYGDPKQGWWEDEPSDDNSNEMDFLHLDWKDFTPHTILNLSPNNLSLGLHNARMRWKKTINVICISNYLQLEWKRLSNARNINKAQRRWRMVLSVMRWFFVYLEARR